MGRFQKKFGQKYLEFNLSGGHFYKKIVTESQTLKGTQYKGGWNFFVPDFNKLPYSLRSQGDKKISSCHFSFLAASHFVLLRNKIMKQSFLNHYHLVGLWYLVKLKKCKNNLSGMVKHNKKGRRGWLGYLHLFICNIENFNNFQYPFKN